ncbi:MAG: DsbA family protein [Rhodospirillaceae bacterium]|nr:DsbA family protein [Rhodospirillaceae bacterium]
MKSLTWVCAGAALMMAGATGVPAGAQTAAPKAATPAFTPAQEQDIKALVREYLLANPEILNEMVEGLQERETAERQAAQKAIIAARHDEIFNPPEATVIGNPKGDVTVVEFFDYNCGYCKSMFPSLMDVLDDDRNVRLVLKELPILGPASEIASKAALAARKQGKYAEFHRAMITHRSAMSETVIYELAAEVGLDVARLKSDMKDKSVADIIARNRALAKDLQVTGTPAVFVADDFYPGAMSAENLKAAIADARK